MILSAPEIELTALAKVFYEPSCLYELENGFNPNHFQEYKPYAQAVKSLHLSKHPINSETVKTWLTNTITPFSTSVIEKIDFRCEPPIGLNKDLLFLHELFLKREAIRVCSETIQMVEEGKDIFDALDAAERNINGITAGMSGNNIKTLAELEADFVKDQEAIMANNGVSGILTGLKTIDGIFNGIKKPDLLVIAARPGMGKTAFVVSIARNMAVDLKHKVGVF